MCDSYDFITRRTHATLSRKGKQKKEISPRDFVGKESRARVRKTFQFHAHKSVTANLFESRANKQHRG